MKSFANRSLEVLFQGPVSPQCVLIRSVFIIYQTCLLNFASEFSFPKGMWML